MRKKICFIIYSFILIFILSIGVANNDDSIYVVSERNGIYTASHKINVISQGKNATLVIQDALNFRENGKTIFKGTFVVNDNTIHLKDKYNYQWIGGTFIGMRLLAFPETIQDLLMTDGTFIGGAMENIFPPLEICIYKKEIPKV